MTPQEVLMNCLADAERLEKVVIIAYCKDETYESWNNELADHEAIGLMRQALIRREAKIAAAPSEPIE